MILHLSKQLASRLKCEVSWKGAAVLQSGRIDSWSGDCFRIGKVEHVLMMNDNCLYAILMRAKGLHSLDALLREFLPRVAEAWHQHGAEFDPANQEVLVLERANRSLAGSMNDAIRMVKLRAGLDKHPAAGKAAPDLVQQVNATPFKAIGFETPDRLLARRLARK